jgi:hypothetical protein
MDVFAETGIFERYLRLPNNPAAGYFKTLQDQKRGLENISVLVLRTT